MKCLGRKGRSFILDWPVKRVLKGYPVARAEFSELVFLNRGFRGGALDRLMHHATFFRRGSGGRWLFAITGAARNRQ